MQLFLFVM